MVSLVIFDGMGVLNEGREKKQRRRQNGMSDTFCVVKVV